MLAFNVSVEAVLACSILVLVIRRYLYICMCLYTCIHTRRRELVFFSASFAKMFAFSATKLEFSKQPALARVFIHILPESFFQSCLISVQ
jgi:hypothetical protein